jgi:hypothetical protein
LIGIINRDHKYSTVPAHGLLQRNVMQTYESLNPVRGLLVLGAVLCLNSVAAPAINTSTPAQEARVGRVIQVGAQRQIVSLAAAAAQAQSGDTVEVDAGDYVADAAVWTQDNLTIRAMNGRAHLIAQGVAAEGRAIWVVRGGRITVEGFDFTGAKAATRNGAGILLEKGQLTVRDCRFTDNEDGILTSGDPETELSIENSEFGNNGFGDGNSHNLYVGRIKKLTVTGSYFHHARVGHLLKSRAAENYILYNRLTDGTDGHASYELEFPNGGLAYVADNQIQQSAQTENPVLISFATEGYVWPDNALYLVSNVLVNDLPKGGIFLSVQPGSVIVKAMNNLLVGEGELQTNVPGTYIHNLKVDQDVFVRGL